MAQNYSIVSDGIDGTYMTAKPVYKTEDELYNDKRYTFFLTTVADGVYRLHSHNSKYIQDYHFYKVHCPQCGCLMEEASPAIDSHVLPMYICKTCRND